MKGLTKRQREIVDFIESYLKEKRYSPSYRDIQQQFGFSSLGTVYNHIQALKKRGFLPEKTQNSRSLVLLSEEQNREEQISSTKASVQLPLIGRLRGGMPIETYAQVKMLTFPPQIISSSYASYLLKVEGYELIEEGIHANDLLLVYSKNDFSDNEMVLAQVGGHTTFIKRAFHDPPYIRLESTNPEVQALILREDHVQILGIILSLMRSY